MHDLRRSLKTASPARTAIEVPHRLAHRPLYRGLPIPFVAFIRDDGDPDFRIVDDVRRMHVILERRCQLCGEPLGRFIFFIGGKIAADKLEYFEPPIHLDCMVYAMQVCPFILGKIEHADFGKVQGANPDVLLQAINVARNPWWMIVKATGYHLLGNLNLRPDNVLYISEPLHAETMSAADWQIAQKKLADG